MTKKLFYLLFVLPLFTLLLTSCSDDDDEAISDNGDGTATLAVNSCEGCHTNYEHLKAVHTPDPPVSEESHGCGGPPPYYEPYDRVYMGGDGYMVFKASVHGKIECVTCHNGVDNTDDKAVAHSGNFIKKPSHAADEKCGTCHADIVDRTENSLHKEGWGQKRMLVQRYGAGPGTSATLPSDFASLPESMKEGYSENCFGCHGTCGECHITRPKAMGGGLARGHMFEKTPDMRSKCVGCHSSRGGHAYFGEGIGTVPDVHLSKAGYTCIDCHSQDEIHGTGEILETRYKMPLLPECTDCHNGIEEINSYHRVHLETFNCQTCHSQDYNNCGNCHIGAGGAEIPSHQKFKIAMNPIPEIKTTYKFATVRQSLMGPASWAAYGVADLPNFNSNPTYKYTTPHNIQKWTARTDTTGGKSCFESCHIIKEGDVYKNKEYYLFEADLDYDWEIPANINIVVDGKLPNGWE